MKNAGAPTVSAIIPTYNRAHLVGRAIKSVLAQTWQDLELIVVDDGSQDDTESVVNSFDDPRIRYIRHPVNRGVSAARNSGIKEARGDYIAFLDSDDEWAPTKLERQLNAFQTSDLPQLGVVTCGLLQMTPGEKEGRPVIPRAKGWVFDKLLGREIRISFTPTFLVRHNPESPLALFDERLPVCEDWDYLLQVSRRYQVEVVPEPLVKVYNPGGPRISTASNIMKALPMVLEKYADEYQRRPKALARHYTKAALCCHLLKDRSRTRHYLRKAVKTYPFNPAALLWLAGSYLGSYALRGALKLARYPYSQAFLAFLPIIAVWGT